MGVAVVDLEAACFTTSFSARVAVGAATGVALEHRAPHTGGNVPRGAFGSPRWSAGEVGRGL